jgi:ribonuclease Z
MQFDVTILGSNGAIAAYDRFPSSQIVNYNSNLFLIDCGEGTQFRMNKFGIKRGRLDNIFISHLHGDHYFGLIGLLVSFNLNWRDHPLNIFGPPELEEIIQVQFKASQTRLRFDLNFHPVLADKAKIIFEDDSLTVETIILRHRLPTTGFLFKEKVHKRKIIASKIEQYNIPYEKIVDIKAGENFTDIKGNEIPNAELTADPPPTRSYAYCSDTIFTESYTEQIKRVGTLYHEATFADEHAERAQETFHSTSKQAAQIATQAHAGKLLIGHFSARYENLDILLAEARDIFSETYLAEEGKVFTIENSGI